jgi:hypothetical protein
MTLRSGAPGPTCANPHPWGANCCSYDIQELNLSPEQQTVGVHPMEPSACTFDSKHYIDQCMGWGGFSGTCGYGSGGPQPPTAIEVISIDATQITLKEATAGADADAGPTWGAEYTVPRCP